MRNKALEYEVREWCSTYLLVNEDLLNIEKRIWIEGYFTLSNKVLSISKHVSNRRKKGLQKGLSKSDQHIHFILIGHLGKYIAETSEDHQQKSKLHMEELLNEAFGVIYEVKERIVCNCVLVECKELENLCHLYETYGFKRLQNDKALIQYFKII